MGPPSGGLGRMRFGGRAWSMTPGRRLASLAVATVLVWPHPILALESGPPRWRVEHFGADVSILRATGPDTGASPNRTDLLLACEGGNRRLRLAVPRTGAEHLAGVRRTGSLLVRASPSGPQGQAVVARYALQDDGVILIQDGIQDGPASAVLSIARILAMQPAGLTVVMQAGTGPVAIGRLVALHQPLAFGRGDAAAIRDFIEACSPKPTRPEPAIPPRGR